MQFNQIPAFPEKRRIYRDGYATNDFEPHRGMTLRDYFAAKCDVSLYTPLENLRKRGFAPTVEELAEYITKIRYIEADAMMRQRGE